MGNFLLQDKGCNPVHLFLGVNPIEDNVSYFWEDMHKIVLAKKEKQSAVS